MTAQLHELLILDGQATSMAFCPPLPEMHSRICESGPDEVESNRILRTTACWRRYVGTWEVRDGRFYLIDLRGRFKLREGGPILADWFTGVLRIPKGERLQYVHMGFGSVYEKEIHIKVESGVVAAKRVICNRGRKHVAWKLSLSNMPGRENKFPGDDAL